MVFIDPCPGCENVVPGIVTPGWSPSLPLTRRWGGGDPKKKTLQKERSDPTTHGQIRSPFARPWCTVKQGKKGQAFPFLGFLLKAFFNSCKFINMSLQKTIFFNQIIKISKCSINKSFRIDTYLIYPKIILNLIYFCTSNSVFRGVFSKTDLSESNYNFSIIKFKLKENWINKSLKRDSCLWRPKRKFN